MAIWIGEIRIWWYLTNRQQRVVFNVDYRFREQKDELFGVCTSGL